MKTDILSIVSNLDDNETIVASNKENEMSRKRFLLETYTRGLDYLKTTLTNSDTISITSIVILTLPYLLFSRINLPSTSILF